MSVLTIEGLIDENGRIQIIDKVQLPKNIRVFIVIPEVHTTPILKEKAIIYSPRLVHPEDMADFKLEVIEDSP
jgi:hypothetical protein